MTGSSDKAVLEFGGFVLDPARRTLAGPGGVAIHLKPRVFDTLAALAAHAGEVVSKRELMETVWPGVVVEENNLSQAISALRKALGDGARGGGQDGGRLIVTVPGRGYQFAPAVMTPGALPSIAVLPFDDISPAHDQSHLCRGMTDELLAHLRRMEDITVTGGEWVRTLMTQNADPRRLGRRLAVTYLLEGSVRRDGARLRIAARLAATSDGFLIWAEEYDRELLDILDLQEEIASTVADALRVALTVRPATTARLR